MLSVLMKGENPEICRPLAKLLTPYLVVSFGTNQFENQGLSLTMA